VALAADQPSPQSLLRLEHEYLLSFAVVLGVGLLYGALPVESRAPPLIALLECSAWCWGKKDSVGFQCLLVGN
jgi:xanthosine utilization system XapX-like protein